jgi:hypothetical protein
LTDRLFLLTRDQSCRHPRAAIQTVKMSDDGSSQASLTSGDAIERLSAICAQVDFDLARVQPSLLARLRLLAAHTETVNDSERMVSRARDVFRYCETATPPQAFSEAERRIVVLGCLLSDIGKTGPVNADADGQRLIVEMFAVEGVRDDQQPVAEFFRTYFPDAEERIRLFTMLGLSPQMSLRAFWNLHSSWTLQIVEAGGVPREVVAAAATHHLLDDVNPDRIVASDRRFTRSFGDNAGFDRAEKLIILLDKYDALRRRGGRTHEQAMAWLRDRLDSNARFRGDVEFWALIADLEAALR